ncbi:transmembrane protein 233-like [Bolinopsis microptera]|uniref:transmembrane protein 233-like n=1 Tax=Bolinopsis microptera TaxID=2820187 RepID=UPI003078E3BD
MTNVYPQTQSPPPQPQVVVVQQGGVAPQTNAVLAWISCLCFFWPIGLVAVLKANEADKCIGRGDFEGGRRSGEAAKKWAIAAIVTPIVLMVVAGIIYYIVFAVLASKAVASVQTFDWN